MESNIVFIVALIAGLYFAIKIIYLYATSDRSLDYQNTQKKWAEFHSKEIIEKFLDSEKKGVEVINISDLLNVNILNIQQSEECSGYYNEIIIAMKRQGYTIKDGLMFRCGEHHASEKASNQQEPRPHHGNCERKGGAHEKPTSEKPSNPPSHQG